MTALEVAIDVTREGADLDAVLEQLAQREARLRLRPATGRTSSDTGH